MVCDNSKCRLEGEEPCLREYAIDRRCSTFGDAYLVLDDALAACARHENCSGVYDPGCDDRETLLVDGLPVPGCRTDYCRDWYEDCCASMDWGEPATCSNGYVPVPANPSGRTAVTRAAPPISRTGPASSCAANEALADHPASGLHDTQGCVVTCAAWNVSDCTAPTHAGAVADRDVRRPFDSTR